MMSWGVAGRGRVRPARARRARATFPAHSTRRAGRVWSRRAAETRQATGVMSARGLLMAAAVPITPRVEADLRTQQRRRETADSAVLASVLRHVRHHLVTRLTATNDFRPGTVDPDDPADPAEPARGAVTTAEGSSPFSDPVRPTQEPQPPTVQTEASHRLRGKLPRRRRRRLQRAQPRDGGRDGDRDGVTAAVTLVGCVTVLLVVLLCRVGQR